MIFSYIIVIQWPISLDLFSLQSVKSYPVSVHIPAPPPIIYPSHQPIDILCIILFIEISLFLILLSAFVFVVINPRVFFFCFFLFCFELQYNSYPIRLALRTRVGIKDPALAALLSLYKVGGLCWYLCCLMYVLHVHKWVILVFIYSMYYYISKCIHKGVTLVSKCIHKCVYQCIEMRT